MVTLERAGLGRLLSKLERAASDTFEMAETFARNRPILFTTEARDRQKGSFIHGILIPNSVIKKEWHIGDKDVDLPVFPLFALFSTALGAKVVIPDMDPTRPAFVDPAKMVQIIEEHKITYSFGSPAFDGVSSFVEKRKVLSLHTVLMAGAPSLLIVIRWIELWAITPMLGFLTEQPRASRVMDSGQQIREETGQETKEGRGYCVGQPLSCNTVKIIKVVDDVIAQFADAQELPTNEIGEICVKGPVVTNRILQEMRQRALPR